MRWPRRPSPGRNPSVNKPGLAEDAAAALKSWGECAAARSRTAAGRRPSRGRPSFPAAGRRSDRRGDQPTAVQRALDLLELPVPDEGVQAVVAFFDADKRLTETLVLYRPA